MHKTANNRFSLFVLLAAACMFFQPAASFSQTTLHATCPAYISKPPAGIEQASDKSKDEPLSGTLYNSGDPTAEEQYMLELINWARANPIAEGAMLDTTTDINIIQQYQGWKTPTPSQVASDFSGYSAQPPYAMNADLIKAARGHDNEMIIVDSQYHVGPDADPSTRMTNAGYDITGWSGENVEAYGTSDIWADNANFLIDFGNPGLGHRENIMNFEPQPANPSYSEIGIGIVHGNGIGPAGPEGPVGPVLTTEDFAQGGKNFVLGVVYSDSNQNGFYDMGEGDSGVTITLSSGTTYYAVSSGSGGYAIPYTGSGSVTVTATGGVFKTTKITKSVDLNGVNVKVDFGPNLSGIVTQVMLVSPVADTTVNTSSVDFVWDTMPVATKYHIQVATDPLMKNIIHNDSTKDVSMAYNGFNDTTTYYWRVQAENAKGFGKWSVVDSFYVQLVPTAVALLSPANASDVGDTSISFTWNNANYEDLGYFLIICSDNAMMDTVVQDMPQDTDDAISADFYLNAGQTYYWEVLAQNEIGWSAPSAIWSFTTASASVAPSISTSSTPVTISPNPSQGSAQLQFTLPTSEDVSLRVFNSLGEQVQSLDLGWLSAGSNEYVWDGSGLLNGSYVCQLRMGDQIQNARVVILK